jgi:hypothetical protein
MTIDIKQTTTVAEVDVKPSWTSKINWTQAVGVGASVLVLLTGGKINIPAEVQAEIVIGIQAAQGIVTFVLKTWFTKTITAESAAAPDVPTKEVMK